MRRFAILVLVVWAVLDGCSRTATPPAGRWIGQYDSGGVMVDARLEITPKGFVRVSAPDFLGTPQSDQDRATIHAQLAADLASGWDDVELRQMDFDGRVFRKPGGVAPQMEWDPASKTMKVVFYFGMQHSIRIDMQQVADFKHDPWAG